MTTPPPITARLVGSHFSGWLGCSECALSSETEKERESIRSYSLAERQRLSAMRESTLFKKPLPAPCSVWLPTSSLSKHAATSTPSPSFGSAKAEREAATLDKLSMRGEERNSPWLPLVKGCSAQAANRSKESAP